MTYKIAQLINVTAFLFNAILGFFAFVDGDYKKLSLKLIFCLTSFTCFMLIKENRFR